MVCTRRDSCSRPEGLPLSSSLLLFFAPERCVCSQASLLLSIHSRSPPGFRPCGTGGGWGGSPTPHRLTSDRLPRCPGPGGRRDGWSRTLVLVLSFSTFTSLTGCQRRPAAPSCSAGSTSSPPPVQYCSVCVLGAASAHRNVPCSAFPFSARPPRRPASVGFYVRVSFRGLICQEKKRKEKSVF